MIKRQRYYDGWGNELRIDEIKSGTLKITINKTEINIPVTRLIEMLKEAVPVKGKHAKVYEVRG
jgi:hypothetical protein